MKTCGIISHLDDQAICDKDGCLKPDAHNDAHVFKNADGIYVEWEDDYGCKCGCWEDEDDLLNVCKVYRYLTEE